MTIDELHKWALPASIALLSGATVVSAAVIAVPLYRLTSDEPQPVRVELANESYTDDIGATRTVPLRVNGDIDGNLELSSRFGLGGGF